MLWYGDGYPGGAGWLRGDGGGQPGGAAVLPWPQPGHQVRGRGQAGAPALGTAQVYYLLAN